VLVPRLAGAQANAAEAPSAEQRVERVETLVARADFEAAESEARLALASGMLGPAELARVYRELGVLAAARTDAERAGAAFRRALILAPDLALPPSAGPHVVELLERARRENQGRPRPTPVVLLTPASESVSVDARVEHDAEGLARRLVLDQGGKSVVYPLEPAGLRTVLPVPGAERDCIEVRVSVADEHGNLLWPDVARRDVCPVDRTSRGSSTPPKIEPAGGSGPVLPAPALGSERPVPTSVWIGVGLTGALTAATGVLGVVALDRRADFDDKNADPSVVVEDRQDAREAALSAQHRATAAGIAAAVAGGVTLTLFLARPTVNGPAVEVGVGPSSIAFSGRF
jgi:hypothetical protein